MRCVTPFVVGKAAFRCGKCQPCLSFRRSVWSHRILLEAQHRGPSCFVTLTYSDDRLPADWSLVPGHLQKWLKRFRARIAPERVRFFACGEYGSRTRRPHYHVALFGVACSSGYARGGCECRVCSAVRETWGFGHILIGSLTAASASYISRYVCKKMNRFDDPRLEGRHPEFARMSSQPGIGVSAIISVAWVLSRQPRQLRAPSSLFVNGRWYPVGGFLVKKCRELLGERSLRTVSEDPFVPHVRAYALANNQAVSEVYRELYPHLSPEFPQFTCQQKEVF